jgi:5-methylcytosine-specific restriction enzyme A
VGETERSVRDLLERYGQQGEWPRADYPVTALRHAGLWELADGAGPVPNAHGDARLHRWFGEHWPRGGLVPAVYELGRTIRRR